MFKGCKILFYIFLLTCSPSYADESKSDQSDSSNSGASPEGKSSENDQNYFVLLTQCDESNPSTTCTCDLTDALKALASQLNPCQQQIFLQWEAQLESQVLVQINLPASQRAVMVYQSVSQLSVSHSDIYGILEFQTIKSYGRNLFLFKDLKKTALAFAIQSVGSSINLDSSNNCPLFDALRSSANSCGTSSTSAPSTVSGSTASGATGSTATGSTATGSTGSTASASTGAGSTASGSTATGTAGTGSTATGSMGTGSAGTATTPGTAATMASGSCSYVPPSCSSGSTGSTIVASTASGSTGSSGSTVTGSPATGSTASVATGSTGSTATGSTGSTAKASTGTGSTGATSSGTSGTGSTAASSASGSTGTGPTAAGSTVSAASTPSSAACQQVNCTSLQSNVNVLISQLTVILQAGGPNSQLLVQVYQQLQSFFAQNPGSQAMLGSGQISGFFSVQIIFEISQLYFQASSSSINIVFSGDFSNNPLLLALQAQVTNPAVPTQFQDLINTLYDDLNGFFQSNSDNNARFKQFSFLYYQYTTDNPGLQQFLDKLQLGSVGCIGDMIIVSATISFTVVDFSQIDQLINNTNGWNNTILVQSFYATNSNWNKTFYFHGYSWLTTQWILFRNTYINNNVSLIISDTSMTPLQKHVRIQAVFQKFISIYSQQQFFYCTPLTLPNGKVITVADYHRYTQASPAWKCEIPRGCMGLRNDLTKVKPDNTTDLTNGFQQWFASASPSDAATVQPYYNQISSLVFGPAPQGGPFQLVAQVVQVLQNLLAQVCPANSTTPAATTASSATGSTGASSGAPSGSTAASTGAGSTAGSAGTGSTAAGSTGSTAGTGSTATPTAGTTAAPTLCSGVQGILFSNWGHLQKFVDCQGPQGTNTQYPSK